MELLIVIAAILVAFGVLAWIMVRNAPEHNDWD